MDTKKTSADLIRDFFKKSNGIIDFSQRIFSFFEDNEDSDLWKIFERICNYLEEYKVKIVTERSPGVYEYLNGGLVEKEHIKMLDKSLTKSLGFYVSNINFIFINIEAISTSSTINIEYGIDQHLLDNNFMVAFCSVYMHEILHAIMFNQGLPLMPDSPEILSIKNQVSKAGKMNNLWYLKVIDNYWQEIITHIVSSKNYYHWLLDNNLSFDLSKALNKVFVDEKLRQDVIDFINGWTKKFYSESIDLVYFIPDYAKSENFMSREFFANYPTKILGSEISTTNRWGKPIYKTKRIESDHSIDDILGRVENIPGLDWESFDNFKKIDQETSSDVEDINKSIQESIERKKKQKENGEVEVIPDLISFTESVNLYNVVPGYLSWLEIEAYLFCYPGENKLLWREKFEYTEEQILSSESTITLNKQMDNECTITIPTVIFTGEANEFFSLFLHGDVFSKTHTIRSSREEIIVKRGEEYYNKLIESLESIKFVSVTFDNEDYNKRPFISPVSETSKEFKITKFIGSENRYRPDEAFSLLEAFLYVVGDREGIWFKSSRYSGVIPNDMEHVMKGHRLVERPYRGKDLTAGEKAANDEADNRNANKFDFVFEQTCICFSDFIRECLEESDRKKLEEEISGFYNKFCFTDLEKIPVGFTHSSRFKRTKLHLKNLQRNSIAFVNINKTGLLAHEVGTGKSLSTLATISNYFDTNRANKALIVVPTTIYEKWINECKNHTEKITNPDTGEEEEIEFYGAFPHLNVVGLSNLSDKVLLSLKEYTAEEKKKIANVAKAAKSFYDNIKKSIKGIAPEEIKEVADDSNIDDAAAEERETRTKKDKLTVMLPVGYANAQAFVNNMLKDVDIEALAGFGISNEENKNYSAIYSVLNNNYNNNTLSYTFKKYYIEAGERLDNIYSFDSIHENIHASVILSYVFDTYSILESHLVATLGTFKEFPSKTIFFTTYVGLARFGFKDDTIGLMSRRLLEILKGAELEGESKAKIEKNIESLLERSTIDAKVFFEDFGFDYIAIDEAHRLKNLITTITTKDEEERDLYVGNKSQIKTVKGGSQSKIALTGFMATMYVQMKNGGRNTLLLTATPFTNSPLEIYSMLTLINYNYLTNLGYPDVLKFAQDFIKIKAQLSISVEGTVKTKIEPIGYTNLSLLRRIIYTLIDFRSAEESNIMRPCKIVLPIREKSTLCDSRTSHGFSVIKPVSTIVIPSRQQQLILDALQVYLSSQVNKRTVDEVFMSHILKKGNEFIKKVSFSDQGMEYSEYMVSVSALASKIKETFNVDKEGKPIEKLFSAVAILKTLMAMRNVAISPYMFRPYVNGYLEIADADIDPYQVIMQSTKLLYMVSCIKSANLLQKALGKDLKGFVIYSNLGTKPGKNSPISLLKIIKQYLLDETNEFGYRTGVHQHEDFKKKFDDVEILDGESAANPRKKNALMNLFNRGQIKVIITTIREGVDLNGDTITLFNLSVDWNPTDAKQIEGRAWRQGNKNAYCIIVYPLTANSSDMAIYQKLQDKTARLKALWDKNSNLKSAFDLDEFNPEELKMEMISNVSKLAPFIFNEETTLKRYEYDMLKSKRDEDGNVINNFKIFQEQELKLRYAMTLFSKLPKILEHQNKYVKLIEEKGMSSEAIDNIKKSIDEAKRYLPEYDALNKVNQEISDLENTLRVKAGEIGTAIAMDENEKVPVIKKEIETIKTQIADKKKEVEKAEKAMEKALSDSIKESQEELEKEEKELKKIQKAMDVLAEEKPFDEPDVPAEFEFTDINKGNYFVKSESGTGIVYKTFDKFKLSLDKIDWIKKATIFDLFEGLTRIIEMYTNINSQFSVAFADYQEEQLDLTYLLVNNYNVLPQEAINDLNNYIRSYDGMVHKSRLLGLAKDFQSTYDRQYWNIYWAAQMKMSILRSLRDYKSIVEDKDPDVYLQEFDEKIEQLYQEIGASENMSDIPDNVLEKYINQAYEIISKRRLEFENYTSLVDGYASFSDLFNIELESVFVNKNLVKELADEATIDIKGEVIDEKEGAALILSYQDKIDVYKEMIEEAIGDEKQMYIDKIEVYQEMINDLKSK
ncbi:MAG: SNF2-related protein [Atribacterota bacterium]|nr:SNF2-related protein [Atribacterota bacterium]